MRYLFLLIFIATAWIIGTALERLLQASGSGVSLTDPRGAGQILLFTFVIIAIILFQHFVARARFSDYFGAYARQWRRALVGLATMFLIAVAVFVSGYLGLALAGRLEWSVHDGVDWSVRVVLGTLVALLVVFVLATTEELIFRGFVLRYLRWSEALPVTIAAIIVSAIIFSLAHTIARTTEPITIQLLIGLFMLGLLLASVYIATGSIACSIGIHAGLLGCKVVARKLRLFEVATDTWWLADKDLRTSPLVWLLFAVMSLAALYGSRHRRRLAIEPMVGDPSPTMAAFGSRPATERG